VLLVIGARGKDGFQRLRLGSVSSQVARYAKCSVVVVPERGDRADGDRDRRIVVGVDGSTGSNTALAFAFAEAACIHAELCAIHVFDASSMQTMTNLPQAELQRLHVRAADTLCELLAPHADGYPDVHAYSEMLSGAPASALVSAAADTEMLVLGARGHGDIATLMLGSTSQTVLHNATCPVAVVRDNR
jgi:nucleotide-binding universal stress UspA family protein